MRKKGKSKILAGILTVFMLTNVLYTTVPINAVGNESLKEQEMAAQTEEQQEVQDQEEEQAEDQQEEEQQEEQEEAQQQTQAEEVRVLDCPLEVHQHTEDCYDQDYKLICGQADFVVHTHDENCYDSDGQLVCTLSEKKVHRHEDSCYTKTTELVCGQENASEHVHTDACYQTEQVLTCGFEESEGHTHGAECYEHVLTCAIPESEEHTHSEECYEDQLICTIPESEGHTHTETCYTEEKTLICSPHVHTDMCYSSFSILTCHKEAIELHTHQPSCYDQDGVLICDKLEVKQHQHTDECFQEVEASDAEDGEADEIEEGESEDATGETQVKVENNIEEAEETNTEEIAAENELKSEEAEITPEPLDPEIIQNLSRAIVEAASADTDLWNQVLMAMYGEEEESCNELAEQFAVEPEIMQQYLQELGDAFNKIYDAMDEDEEGTLWEELMNASYNQELLDELAERFGIDTEMLLLFIQYNGAGTGTSTTSLQGTYDSYTLNGNVAFSLNPDLTKKETEGVSYTLVLTNPGNDTSTVQKYCTNPYNDGLLYGTKYTAGSILWCLNRYNEQYANLGVQYGIPEANKWEGLRQAIQYAVWYYSSSYTSLSESSSNPIEKLAYTIKADAWKASGTTSGDGKIYWYQSNDSSAPNLVTFAYSGATASTYIGHRGTYIADRGDITNAITLTCNGQTQLGFCYDPAESNPLGDTYYYSGVLSNDSTNNTIRKILYNGYPTNKELLDQTGLSPDTLWYQTQQALWHIQNGRDGTGNLDLYNFLLGNEPSVTINGVTVTRRNPPDDYVMYCYWAPNRQRIVVTEEPLLVNLSGTKTWVGDDENTRPTSVQMQLYKRVGGIESPVLKDGALVTFSATAANNWTYQFSNMPRYENEETIQYFVKELNVPDGYTAKVDGMNITNTKISSQKFALTLKKLVDGRFANKNKAFAFTITLKDENGSNVNDSFDVETSSDVSSSSISNGKITFTDGTAKVDLAHEQEITIKALPKGYTYEIQEELEGNEFYIKNISVNDAAVSGQSEGNTGVRTVNQDETVTYTNKSNDDIAQTGLRTDFAPNVIFLTLTLLLGGLLCIMSFKTRKNAKR